MVLTSKKLEPPTGRKKRGWRLTNRGRTPYTRGGVDGMGGKKLSSDFVKGGGEPCSGQKRGVSATKKVSVSNK